MLIESFASHEMSRTLQALCRSCIPSTRPALAVAALPVSLWPRTSREGPIVQLD
jgi:hypothetical protein